MGLETQDRVYSEKSGSLQCEDGVLGLGESLNLCGQEGGGGVPEGKWRTYLRKGGSTRQCHLPLLK